MICGCLHSMTDQTSCCVDDGLQSVQELCRNADQQRITVIKLCQHKTGDERHNSMTRQRPLDAPQMMQDAKTACSSSGDVCRHGCINVQIKAEVSNGADGRNIVGTDTERYGGNLVHHITSVFAAFSCRWLLLIHADMQIYRQYRQTRHSQKTC